MAATDISIFGVTLFLALVALLRWKRRRDKLAERLNQILRGYIAVQEAPEPAPKPAASPMVKVA